jgi:hypothetical protein
MKMVLLPASINQLKIKEKTSPDMSPSRARRRAHPRSPSFEPATAVSAPPQPRELMGSPRPSFSFVNQLQLLESPKSIRPPPNSTCHPPRSTTIVLPSPPSSYGSRKGEKSEGWEERKRGEDGERHT